jgi:hypothetical protein
VENTLKRSAPIRFARSLAVLALAGCGFLPISKMSTAGTEVLQQAPKPSPVDSEFEGCGPAGAQPDYELNRRKDRIDSGSYVAIPWGTIARLAWPREVGFRFRQQWTSGETAAVARYEGAGVQLEGYLVAYKLEVPEPPNCYSTQAAHRDFHLWVSEKPDGSKRRSIVVELTPRIRYRHPGWTEDQLDALIQSKSRVRLTGWLMFDQMHPENVGRNRITLWEIHPVTRIEWQRDSTGWISLDNAAARPPVR